MPSKISGVTLWADRVGLIPVLQFSQTLEVGHCVPEGSERSRVAGNVPPVLLTAPTTGGLGKVSLLPG